ncbi:MAG: glutamate--tRNA ligase [Actinomycetes bacterium]
MTDPTASDPVTSARPGQQTPVRVRFCPSPTGNPHVGLARTALFNWAFARHHGGTFVFRIEDTDSQRDSEESYEQLLSAMRWLGLDWDEGPEVGGPFGPYRQSERLDRYREVAAQLVDAGFAYRCYCTSDELEVRRDAARAALRAPGYDGHCRNLSDEQVAAYEAEDRTSVIRFRMPEAEAFTWSDLVRGDVTFPAGEVSDYVLVRANGDPLYTLVNPVDDALMQITHVLRGEDLLSSTPRQLALWGAMKDVGVAKGPIPAFGHLPYVMGEGNKKLSKRDPESSLLFYVEQGYLPEGMTNYLALLGWSLSEDRDRFSLAEMAEAFDIARVNASPARFDLKKCTALNADWIRLLDAEEFGMRLDAFLTDQRGVALDGPARQVVADAASLVQERVETLAQAADMLHFLLVDEAAFAVDPTDAAKMLTADSTPVLQASMQALGELSDWSTVSIEGALRASLVDGLGLKPRLAFGPVRVAVSGRRVSPPLFESLEMLGRERSIARLTAALALATPAG